MDDRTTRRFVRATTLSMNTPHTACSTRSQTGNAPGQATTAMIAASTTIEMTRSRRNEARWPAAARRANSRSTAALAATSGVRIQTAVVTSAGLWPISTTATTVDALIARKAGARMLVAEDPSDPRLPAAVDRAHHLVNHLFAKIGARDRAPAVAYAFRNDLGELRGGGA